MHTALNKSGVSNKGGGENKEKKKAPKEIFLESEGFSRLPSPTPIVDGLPRSFPMSVTGRTGDEGDKEKGIHYGTTKTKQQRSRSSRSFHSDSCPSHGRTSGDRCPLFSSPAVLHGTRMEYNGTCTRQSHLIPRCAE